MKTSLLCDSYRYLVCHRFMENCYKNARKVCSIRNYSELSPPEKVRQYDVGDFSNDLKPYLIHQRKSRVNRYLQERFRNEHPIIKCKDPRLNHYQGQTYEKFSAVPLASEHWRGHKSVGDTFTIKIHPGGYKDKYNYVSKDFIDSDLHPSIVDSLKKNGIEMMSEIQELAIPPLLEGRDCVIAAETGCGKTLAYLPPIIHQVLEYKRENSKRTHNSPYVVIVTPNRELTEQVREVVQWFKDLDIASQKALGGNVKKKIMNPVVAETDILVTTPIVIHKLLEAGIFSLDHVRHIVLDEADTLMDDSFSEYVVKLLHAVRFSNPEDGRKVQLCLVSATMPTSLPEVLGEVMDTEKLLKITTKELHLVMPHVKQKFIRVLRSTKPAYLLRLVKQNYEDRNPVIVFCNHADTCTWVSEFLRESGVSNINLSGTNLLRQRKGKFKIFQQGGEIVLVSTDVASRGLDTKQVRHVLNYDFPLFIADYIHRSGRTGRLGSNANGRVTNLISGKNEIHLVQKIELAVRCNVKLENVNANIKRIIKFRNASTVEKKLGAW